MDKSAKLITMDAHRRINLNGIGHPHHTRYQVKVEPDGTIVLTPVVVMSAVEVERLRTLAVESK